MKMKSLNPLFDAVARNNSADMLAAIAELKNRADCGPAWHHNFDLLAEFIKTGIPPFGIIAKQGNSKLPFMAFSTLPGAKFCPGAGECLNHCYSFKAHRYPGALCRQIQNTLLLNSESGRAMITGAIDQALSMRKFKKLIAAGQKIDFRLYTDGDFRNLADMHFWFNLLKTETGQNLAVYGYSKSFAVFLEYIETGQVFPSNYLLNLSSGHKYDRAMVSIMEAMECTRGHFKAVPMPYPVKSDMHGQRAHQKALRAQYGRKAFTCPGKCGECTNAGHACGSDRFRGIDIVIAVH